METFLTIIACIAAFGTIVQLWTLYFLQYIKPHQRLVWVRAWFYIDDGKAAFLGAAGIINVFLVSFLYWLLKGAEL